MTKTNHDQEPDRSLPPEIAPEIEEALERMVGAATSPMTLNLLWNKVRAYIKQQAERIRELEALLESPWLRVHPNDEHANDECGWCPAVKGVPHSVGCPWAAAMRPEEDDQ